MDGPGGLSPQQWIGTDGWTKAAQDAADWQAQMDEEASQMDKLFEEQHRIGEGERLKNNTVYDPADLTEAHFPEYAAGLATNTQATAVLGAGLVAAAAGISYGLQDEADNQTQSSPPPPVPLPQPQAPTPSTTQTPQNQDSQNSITSGLPPVIPQSTPSPASPATPTIAPTKTGVASSVPVMAGTYLPSPLSNLLYPNRVVRKKRRKQK